MKRKTSRKRLDELIEEATVDCYNEDEEHGGIVTMIQDNVECPFRAKVIGEEVTVTSFDFPKRGLGLVAVCERNGKEFRVDASSLEFLKPLPEGFEWLEAFESWQGGASLDEDDEDEEDER